MSGVFSAVTSEHFKRSIRSYQVEQTYSPKKHVLPKQMVFRQLFLLKFLTCKFQWKSQMSDDIKNVLLISQTVIIGGCYHRQ